MIKTLVILTGSPRGGLETWETLDKYILEPLGADLAICFGNKFINKSNNYLYEKARYDWTFDEPENWTSYFENNFKGEWKSFLLKGEKYGMAGGLDKYSGSGAIVSAMKNIIYKNHLEEIMKYDFIIHTRADQYYVDYIPKLKEDLIYIPEGEDYFGICDRFIVMHKKFAKKYFNLCEFIDTACIKKIEPEVIAPESVLLHHLINEKLDNYVERVNRFCFTTALKEEETRWRVAKYKLYFLNLLIKYPDEFVSSMENILNKKGLYKVLLSNFLLTTNYYYIVLRRRLGKIKNKILR